MIDAAEVILNISLAVLLLAAAITMWRLYLGPTVLDRAVSIDVIAACVIGAVITLIAWRDRTDLMALLIIFALTAFFSSVTVARYAVTPAIQKIRRRKEREMVEAASAKKARSEAAGDDCDREGSDGKGQ